jgi:hypothetical protein
MVDSGQLTNVQNANEKPFGVFVDNELIAHVLHEHLPITDHK